MGCIKVLWIVKRSSYDAVRVLLGILSNTETLCCGLLHKTFNGYQLKASLSMMKWTEIRRVTIFLLFFPPENVERSSFEGGCKQTNAPCVLPLKPWQHHYFSVKAGLRWDFKHYKPHLALSVLFSLDLCEPNPNISPSPGGQESRVAAFSSPLPLLSCSS